MAVKAVYICFESGGGEGMSKRPDYISQNLNDLEKQMVNREEIGEAGTDRGMINNISIAPLPHQFL